MTEFKSQLWKKRRNLHVIYNTYDNRLQYNDVSDKEEVPIILQIGTGARKNLESTIKAMQGLSAKLLIIGRLSESQKALLTSNNIIYENNFDVPYEKIIDSYNRAKIVVFPTFYEGFGLPVIEAQVMQKPIIASDLEIIREVGADGVFYINPNDTNSIHNAIVTLLGNYKKYNDFVKKGLENSKRFSSEIIFPQYKNLYKSFCK